jgi:hypothetical protein
MRFARSVLLTLVLLASCARANPLRGQNDAFASGDAAASDAGTHDAFVGSDAFSGSDAFAGADVSTSSDAYAGNDAFVPGNDAHVLGAYLDRCSTATDCASGLCVLDRGGSHFCTRSCTSNLMCAQEHVCVTSSTGSVCLPDDTGAPCSVGTPAQCALGLCLGSAAGGHCTRYCQSAAECPAGYACTITGGSTQKICVDIEEPCTAASQCATGYCVGNATMSVGCTAACDSPADCPQRMAGLPAYTCDNSLGTGTTNLCIPPSDILGGDGIGASCPATGTNTCRSDACDPNAALGPMCTQACTAEGRCGPGLGCTPFVNGSQIILLCERAGTHDLLASCAHGSDCESGLCDTMGFCTRLCADGICPTGTTCQPIPGSGIALCRR